MPMTDFFQVFRKLADSELRTATVTPGRPGPLPADLYAFIELYCDEPDCDCRRVTLAVIAESKGRVVAHSNLGFDSADGMAGPFLDLLNVQASFAPALLEFFTDMINHDPAYLGRLHRHYVMFKEHCEGRRYAGPPFEKPGRVKRVALSKAPGFPYELLPDQRSVAAPVRAGGKVGRNDPCPCGSGKKLKQCCLSNPASRTLGTAAAVPSMLGRDSQPAPADPWALADTARQLITVALAWRTNPRH
ncbi:SEC-C metal-binding domain-containing protein [uncultured Thiodictyon sp.]|uniref:SEC-C metal-binding domain-containing protein n=1 Tax=uncultured Thiodictyon sp. TaxID=1846217 RepID=UPI0025EC1A18|nr:SEC-C metal-binding domain-containing protein [uncultured Thiodictyon sp.]